MSSTAQKILRATSAGWASAALFQAALFLSLMICLSGVQAMAADGLVLVPSTFGPQETVQRLEKVLAEKGVTIFARVDHAAGAQSVGLALRPTQLIIFGNPKAGTPLMQANQTIGIDLPLKALIWTDAADRTWLAYDDPAWLAKRHGLGPETNAAVAGLAAALAMFAKAATSEPK